MSRVVLEKWDTKSDPKKAPFANLANFIYERGLVKFLLLYYLIVDPSGSKPRMRYPSKAEIRVKPFNDSEISSQLKPLPLLNLMLIPQEIDAIAQWLKIDVLADEISVQPSSNMRLLGDGTLRKDSEVVRDQIIKSYRLCLHVLCKTFCFVRNLGSEQALD